MRDFKVIYGDEKFDENKIDIIIEILIDLKNSLKNTSENK